MTSFLVELYCAVCIVQVAFFRLHCGIAFYGLHYADCILRIAVPSDNAVVLYNYIVLLYILFYEQESILYRKLTFL